MSKTPKFDKILDGILEKLVPHTRQCLQCKKDFKIYQEDIEFYNKLQVPPPKLCPDCRMQRRFGFYGNILKFHRKECAAHPGENVITTFHSESPYKIFDLKHWWSDKWGGEEYGADYNFNRPFFEQFKGFNLKIPQISLIHYWKNVIDSPYTIGILDSKNCYFTSSGSNLENVHYSYWVAALRDSADLLNVLFSENCYEIIYGGYCYNVYFSEEVDHCIDSAFLYDCKNCSNCFMCSNLRNKNYYFKNQQLSKEKYLEKIKEFNLGNHEIANRLEREFEEMKKKAVNKNIRVDYKNVNCVGDRFDSSKNCYMVFRATGLLGSGSNVNENVRYSADFAEAKDCMDMYLVGPNLSLCYELVEAYTASEVKFSYFIHDGLNLEYCLASQNCKNCFGCVGLRNKKFHIFNKPYSEEEYWQKVDEIKTKMLEAGEYGEFFPLSMALHAYNDTYASVEFPLGKEEIKNRGYVYFENEKEADLTGMETIKAKDVPKDIKDVSDDILKKAIICEKTGKPFRIIKAELDFYRKNNLPIPTTHPFERLSDKLRKRNPSRLWKMNCKKCGKEMFTSYPPEKQKEYKVYCETCYLKEVV